MDKSYYRYIGKLDRGKSKNANYHLLPYHCLDVVATAKALLEANEKFTTDVSELLGIPPAQLIPFLGFFIGIHDLGKFATAFQMLFSDWVDPLYKAENKKPYDGENFRHDRLGLHFWQKNEEEILEKITEESNLDIDEIDDALKPLFVLAEATLGHHGKPINTKSPSELKSYIETYNEQAATEFIQDLIELLKPNIFLDLLADKNWQARVRQISWYFAGLTVLADWLGSNSEYFTYETRIITLEDYWERAQANAQKALHDTDVWRTLKVQPFLSVKEHYGFEPTPLQHWAEIVSVDDTPQLFILEDVTGAGKTEAALVLTHRLMEAGAANGFYFGLPTMATSNAMFSRVAEHYLQMLNAENGSKPSIVLAHGAREMNDLFRESIMPVNGQDTDYSVTDHTATAQCNAWLADSSKKALLAPVGVGTLDQTLLAVLPRRHQSLRLLGLNRKVLIFDEVHSADEYMFELLESLLALHLHQGGSVILLTATLSKKQRQRLIDVWLNTLQLDTQLVQNTHFPLATKVSVSRGLEETSLERRKEVSRDVPVSFLYSEGDCIEKILIASEEGQCVVWVRNTVNDALLAYQQLLNRMEKPENCLLFHSRFALVDRKRIENQVLEIFGKKSGQKLRAGRVLIATQVFQESLDADADLMISDICPIDDLIQRAGRLHRHTRNRQGFYERGITDSRKQPMLYVHAPEWQDRPNANWLSEHFQNTEYVYRSPGRLWLGMQVLKKLGALRMPTEARELIEAVYSEDAFERMPEALQNKEQERLGEGRSKAAKAQSGLINWKQYGYSASSASGWYEDDTDISTRYSDIKTSEVVLLRLNEQGQFDFYAQEKMFSIQLSTVKLGIKKYIDKLSLVQVDDPRLGYLKRKYPKFKFQYLNLWHFENNNSFGYSPNLGVYEHNQGRKA